MAVESWAGSINLETRAVELLRKIVGVLPQDRQFAITVFGSAPLQICVDSSLTSADVDVFSDFEELRELVFRTSPRWKDRTQSARIGNCIFIFPHPIDILIAKLNRLEEKDLLAFRTVLAKTGHPTEAELIHELQLAVDLFRPSFDEEQGHDMANNCRRLWPLIYGREIDPRAEIISPALKIRREGYGEPVRDYKQELRDALKE